MSRYYKFKDVEVKTVRKAEVTRITCDYCDEPIVKGEVFYDITEYATYPEDDANYRQIHQHCLHGYAATYMPSHVDIVTRTFNDNITFYIRDRGDYRDTEVADE